MNPIDIMDNVYAGLDLLHQSMRLDRKDNELSLDRFQSSYPFIKKVTTVPFKEVVDQISAYKKEKELDEYKFRALGITFCSVAFQWIFANNLEKYMNKKKSVDQSVTLAVTDFVFEIKDTELGPFTYDIVKTMNGETISAIVFSLMKKKEKKK